jgi:hypothetical protein
MSRWLIAAVLLSSLIAGRGVAQSAPPATPTEPTPTNPSVPVDSPAKTPIPKKVWTNENLVEAGGSVSVVGDKRNQKYTMTSAKPADPGTVSRIKQDLQKLQGQLEEINQKLTSFKEFQEGETVTKGEDDTSKGYTRTPVNQQMAALQQKKKKLEAQIDALVDEARKKGIEPGQLR